MSGRFRLAGPRVQLITAPAGRVVLAPDLMVGGTGDGTDGSAPSFWALHASTDGEAKRRCEQDGFGGEVCGPHPREVPLEDAEQHYGWEKNKLA